jgi:hypothetical protein
MATLKAILDAWGVELILDESVEYYPAVGAPGWQFGVDRSTIRCHPSAVDSLKDYIQHIQKSRRVPELASAV